MDETQKQYLFDISRQCYSLLHEQINKRITLMSLWITIEALAYGVIFSSAYSTLTIKNILLSILFIIGVLICYTLMGMIAWQKSYKRSCIIIGQIIMNNNSFNNLDELKVYIEDNYCKDYNKRINHSVTMSVVMICLVTSLIPLIFLIYVNEIYMHYITLFFTLAFIFVYIISFFMALKYKLKKTDEVPWLLRFNLSD